VIPGNDGMKTISFVILLISFCLSPQGLHAAGLLSPDDFQYAAQLKGPVKSNVLYKVHLTGEVLQSCLPGCNDLRVFDHDNREIPYVIIENRMTAEKSTVYPLEITGYDDNPKASVITVKMPEKYEPIGVMTLDTQDRDFRKKVFLYGSSDMKNWKLLTEDIIYDFTSQVSLRKIGINFYKSDYRYYRLRLVDNERRDGGREKISLKYDGLDFSIDSGKVKKINIGRITGSTPVEKDVRTVYDYESIAALSSRLDRDRNTEIIIETRLPFDRLFLDVANPYFYRKVTVYYSDTGKKDSYQFLLQQPVYRFQISSIRETKDLIGGTTSWHRFYKIVIENNNNPPLDIRDIRLSWVQRNLFFVGLKAAEYYPLHMGSMAAERPVYDLSKFIHQDNWFREASERLEAAAVQKNAAYRPSATKDRKSRVEKTFLTVVVIVLVIGMGFWLYSLLKKTGSRDQKGG